MTFCGGTGCAATKTRKTRRPRRVRHEDACLLRRSERTERPLELLRNGPGIKGPARRTTSTKGRQLRQGARRLFPRRKQAYRIAEIYCTSSPARLNFFRDANNVSRRSTLSRPLGLAISIGSAYVLLYHARYALHACVHASYSKFDRKAT